jgi:tRNA-guanine transglycosylase
LRPGEKTVNAFGGLSNFMGFNGVTMTDSGGFQVFSLARDKQFGSKEVDRDADNVKLVTISENGVIFRSHLDGEKHFFTPEVSIAIQKKLGADIMLCFDDCAPFPVTYNKAKEAMERTHRWAKRCLTYHKKTKGQYKQALYGVIQGSVFEELRRISASYIARMDFDGFAIGGVAVGEGKKEMSSVVSWVMPLLPKEKIKHLLGVGDIDDIFMLVEQGVDTFDCVTPTRLGRVGIAFVGSKEGSILNRFRIDITKSIYALSKDPLDKSCACYVCHEFSRGYIHHLFRAKELLGYHLVTFHNVHFINTLMKKIREAITLQTLGKLKKEWLG